MRIIRSPAPPMMMRSNTEEATLNTEMMDSCCSNDTGKSCAAIGASSARSIRLVAGESIAAESSRCGAVGRTALVCLAILDPHPLVSG